VSRRMSSISFLVLLIASLAPVSAAAAGADRYIVVLHDDVGNPGSVASEHARGGAAVDHVYRHGLKGYSAMMSATAAARISNDPRVDYVEADGVAHKSVTQSNATWGLDRIDQRALPLSSTYSYNYTGAGVTAYIIDTGISPHSDFVGRVQSGIDYVDDDTNSTDCDGHGTHVAGTVGGTTWGVAKGVTLVGVRVLDCNGSGYWSDVIAGIDWVTGQHDPGEPAVANMSLGGGGSTAVDDAVKRSVADGVTYAVAAGNGNRAGKAQDACGYSPARVPEALTVGATNSSDTKASWSNYGTCLDLFAPGVSITSSVMGGGTESWSGTSMATPHVAGAAALYLDAAPSALPAEVATAITSQATSNAVSSAGSGSPNRLLHSLLTVGGVTPPSNLPPTVSLTSPTAGSVSGSVAVAATAGDTDGTVTEVEFFVDSSTTALATDSDGSNGWTASWDSTSVADGSHTIKATATDDDGATASATVTVTVDNEADPPPSALSLTGATGYKVKGMQKVDLTWAGATSTNVDVYRNGVNVMTTGDDGAETDNINNRGGGSYTYYVCEAGTTTCSNTLTVTF